MRGLRAAFSCKACATVRWIAVGCLKPSPANTLPSCGLTEVRVGLLCCLSMSVRVRVWKQGGARRAKRWHSPAKEDEESNDLEANMAVDFPKMESKNDPPHVPQTKQTKHTTHTHTHSLSLSLALSLSLSTSLCAPLFACSTDIRREQAQDFLCQRWRERFYRAGDHGALQAAAVC